jgi:transcriptional regulator with XRE-family HTH domain
MKLADWLKANDVSFAEFGRRIGRSTEAVRRYANEERIPDRDTMPAVARETRGLVTANDFYPLEHPPVDAVDSAGEDVRSPDKAGETIDAEPELPIAGSHAEPLLPMERAA